MRKLEESRQKGEGVSRRKFLKAVAVSSGAIAAGSLLAGCAGQSAPTGGITLDLTKPENNALTVNGGTLAIDANNLDSQGLLLVRAEAGDVKVYSRRCTHAGCTVGGFENGVARCPCHGSQFDQSGKVIQGPAGAPLKDYQSVLSGSTVTIS